VVSYSDGSADNNGVGSQSRLDEPLWRGNATFTNGWTVVCCTNLGEEAAGGLESQSEEFLCAARTGVIPLGLRMSLGGVASGR